MIKKEILTFVERGKIKDGVTNGTVWTIYGYKTSNGYVYSSLEATYPLEEEIEIEYEIEEVPKTKGDGFWINRRIIRRIVKTSTTVNPKVTQLDQIQANTEEILRVLSEKS